MKLFNKLGITATVVVLGLGGIQTQANAATLTRNMIDNGGFEHFTLLKDKGDWIKASQVRSWETTQPADLDVDDPGAKFELWEPNAKIGGLTVDTNGYHLELNLTNSNGKHDGAGSNYSTDDPTVKGKGTTIYQTFDIDTDSILSGSALFSFDAWSRVAANGLAGTGSVKLVRLSDDSNSEGDDSNSEETLLTEYIDANNTDWTRNTWTVKNISAGDRLRVYFTSDQDHSVQTIHIDDVSFRAKRVPEPTSMLGILAVGAFGTVSTLKRKKLKEV